MAIVERNQETQKGLYLPVVEKAPTLFLLSSIQSSASPFIENKKIFLFFLMPKIFSLALVFLNLVCLNQRYSETFKKV